MPDKKIRDVIALHKDELFSIPGVVGIGEGEHNNNPCIILFVVDKNSTLIKQLPKTIEGYMLKIEGSGEFKAFNGKSR